VSSEKSVSERPLRPGDVVEVKSAAEILATLDGDGALGKMPFMPEMARHAGRRYTVSRRVDKICDTIAATGSRRMDATVYLDDLRCDGSGHGRCQAGCKIYWKETWLRRVDDNAGSPDAREDAAAELERLAQAGTRTVREGEEAPELWRCQATEAFKASEPLKTSNLWQYWREFRNGNFRSFRLLGLLARGFVLEVASRVGLLKPLPLRNSGSRPSPARPLNLRPGERVRVKTPAQIKATLDEKGFDRRLSFDREMLRYCGQTFRVKESVTQIIEEETGRLIKIPKDSIILDGAVCSGVRTTGRWFCPREIYPFWREAWLERVDDLDGGLEESNGAVGQSNGLCAGNGRFARSAPEESMPRVGES
jgi:hypothetical protein